MFLFGKIVILLLCYSLTSSLLFMYPGHELIRREVKEEMKILFLRRDKFLLQIYMHQILICPFIKLLYHFYDLNPGDFKCHVDSFNIFLKVSSNYQTKILNIERSTKWEQVSTFVICRKKNTGNMSK